MYEHGSGVSQDYTLAADWFRKAAEQGNAHAQDELGAAYYFGHGVPQNNDQAMEWLKKSAAQGDSDAQQNLQALKRPSRKVTSELMHHSGAA